MFFANHQWLNGLAIKQDGTKNISDHARINRISQGSGHRLQRRRHGEELLGVAARLRLVVERLKAGEARAGERTMSLLAVA